MRRGMVPYIARDPLRTAVYRFLQCGTREQPMERDRSKIHQMGHSLRTTPYQESSIFRETKGKQNEKLKRR